VRISIVVPVYNGEKYIAAALDSIVSQPYPDLQLIVVDGGSTDGTVEIIRKYEKYIHWWCSEPDQGQYDAVNKGFSQSNGEVMAWLNADDIYFAWTFETVGSIFQVCPKVEWLTTLCTAIINEEGNLVSTKHRDGFTKKMFYRGAYMSTGLPHQRGCVMQEGTFWRRSLWDRAGGYVAAQWDLAGDFELWSRFFKQADLYGVKVPLAQFRRHPSQRSAQFAQRYLEQAKAALEHHDGRLPGRIESMIWRFGPGRLWPLSICPSLGFLHKVSQVSWDWKRGTWTIRQAWQP
jgi:glycosyltransferase involved in cell wall biosynthesis